MIRLHFALDFSAKSHIIMLGSSPLRPRQENNSFRLRATPASKSKCCEFSADSAFNSTKNVY